MPPSLQFGVELELFFPQSVTEEHVASVIPEGWIVKKEESIKCCQDGECQCTPLEVVSPILKGSDGLSAIRATCALLEPLKPNVNKTTGLHVHVGTVCGTWEVDHLRAIAVNFMRLEPAFDALVPPSRRGNDNLHIRSLTDLPRGNERLLRTTSSQSSLVLLANPGDRQYKLNLHALDKHRTVEFRQPAGCSDPKKIVGYVCLFLAFVERSRAFMCPPEPTPTPRGEQCHLQLLKSFLGPSADGELHAWIDERGRQLALADDIRESAWRAASSHSASCGNTGKEGGKVCTDLSTVLSEIHATDLLALEQ